MTRKQAVCRALELLESLGPSPEIAGVIEKLQEVYAEMPFTRWSEDTVHDTLRQFAAERGRNPTAADLKRRGMPPHTVIRLRFGMTAKAFLDTYYPPAPGGYASGPYGWKSKEDWTQDFIRQYKEKKPVSGQRYNAVRDAGSPSWLTIAKYNGGTSWRGLRRSLGLKSYASPRGAGPQIREVRRTITVDGMPLTDEEWLEYAAYGARLTAKGK